MTETFKEFVLEDMEFGETDFTIDMPTEYTLHRAITAFRSYATRQELVKQIDRSVTRKAFVEFLETYYPFKNSPYANVADFPNYPFVVRLVEGPFAGNVKNFFYALRAFSDREQYGDELRYSPATDHKVKD